MIGWIAWILIGLTMLVAIALIIVVMMQDSKEGSSSVLGNNTFYGANKGKTMDGILSKLTVILGIAFIILCFVTTIAITK
ncbi:MAG: preprotein translocase subunit SecG [Clostridia bacterium]|nr:preprotein translocase subunit SecG [Clostridia bacterium]